MTAYSSTIEYRRAHDARRRAEGLTASVSCDVSPDLPTYRTRIEIVRNAVAEFGHANNEPYGDDPIVALIEARWALARVDAMTWTQVELAALFGNTRQCIAKTECRAYRKLRAALGEGMRDQLRTLDALRTAFTEPEGE